MNDDALILEALNPSRRHVRAGDLFMLKPKGMNCYCGRVINPDSNVGGFESVILCDIFSDSSPNREDIPQLDKNNLLISPFGIDRSPWSVGCFDTIRKVKLLEGDVLESHIFKSHRSNKYFYERGVEVGAPR